MRPVPRSLWIATALLLAPIVALAVALSPRLRQGLRERLGGGARFEPGAVWVHGSSVGEALAASHLIAELERRGRRVVASVTTVTGRDALARVLPRIDCMLAPLDHPVCVDRAMQRVRPASLILIETELWPCWIASAARRGVPVVVASGRLSNRSFPRYRGLRWLLAPSLRRLAAVGARSEQDADRFVSLGVPAERVIVTGDLKVEPPEAPVLPAEDLRRAIGGLSILVAGSTHPSEELAALDALDTCTKQGMEVGLVVAPRQPSRHAEVVNELRRRGRRVARRNHLDGEVMRAGDILLLDSIGELAGLYGLASASFVGGTLVPIGGHNLLEPIFAGCPVVYGPHVEEVRGLAELAEASGAGVPVPDAAGLSRAIVELLRDPAKARARGREGQRFLEANCGSATRVVELIERVMRESGSPAPDAGERE